MHLAKSPSHVFTAGYGSESTSELRSLGEMEINARMFFRRPRVFVLRLRGGSESQERSEDSSGSRAVSKIANDQPAIPLRVMLLTGKTSSEAQFTAFDPTTV